MLNPSNPDNYGVDLIGYCSHQPIKYPASAANSVISYSYMNSHLGMATNETITLADGVSILERKPDQRQRLAALTLDGDTLATYDYDSEGRLATVSNTAFTVRYAYIEEGW